MQIDASLLLAIAGILTGIFAFISSRSVDRRAAKRDEVTLLREEVTRLQERVAQLTADNENWRSRYEQLNDNWRDRYEKIYEYVIILRKILIENKMPVPDMPQFDGAVLSSDIKRVHEKVAKKPSGE
jgi:hypothetical protein